MTVAQLAAAASLRLASMFAAHSRLTTSMVGGEKPMAAACCFTVSPAAATHSARRADENSMPSPLATITAGCCEAPGQCLRAHEGAFR